jgi:hypothetical protein
VKCVICGKATLPGAKLCIPCRAALKRARDESVLDLGPRGCAVADAPPDVALENRFERALADEAAAKKRGVRARMYVLAGALVVFVAVVALQLPIGAAPSAHGVQAVDRTAVIVPTPVVATSASAVTSAPPADAASTAPTVEPAVKEPSAKLPKPARAPAHPATEASVESAPAEPPQESPPPREAPVPSAPPPPVDRWRAYADALSRCPRDIFQRGACEQRLRDQVCEGYWGQVAQCPIGTSNDHGQ